MPTWFPCSSLLPMTAHNGVFRGEILCHKTLFDINNNSISAIAWNNRLQQHQRQHQSKQLRRHREKLIQIRNIVYTLRTKRRLPTTTTMTTTTIADDKLKPAIILATTKATKTTPNTIQWIPMKFAILFELATDFFAFFFPFLTLRTTFFLLLNNGKLPLY